MLSNGQFKIATGRRCYFQTVLWRRFIIREKKSRLYRHLTRIQIIYKVNRSTVQLGKAMIYSVAPSAKFSAGRVLTVGNCVLFIFGFSSEFNGSINSLHDTHY